MPTDICEAKRMLRKEILSKRRHLGEEICQTFGRQFAERIVGLDEYKAADNDFMLRFLQRGGGHLEADRKSFGGRQKSSIARVTGPAEMHFYKITSMKDVAPGYYDIPEPLENCQEEVFEGFLVVPGTAFDRQMHRMGYGGGFYDVWLKCYGSQVTACGLAYDFS